MQTIFKNLEQRQKCYHNACTLRDQAQERAQTRMLKESAAKSRVQSLLVRLHQLQENRQDVLQDLDSLHRDLCHLFENKDPDLEEKAFKEKFRQAQLLE